MRIIQKIRNNEYRTIVLFGFIKFRYKKHITYKRKCRELSEQNDGLKRSLKYIQTHIDPKAIKPANGDLRKYQLDLVKFANDFFKEMKYIKPILFAGNMLGAVRHGGFIPWDDDMDFLLIRSDYEKVISWCQEHGVVYYWHSKLSKEKPCDRYKMLNEHVQKHPNTYVLYVLQDHLKLSKGSSFDNQMFIDFFSLDFYKENYSFGEYEKYRKEIQKNIHKIDYRDEATKYTRNEVKQNKHISSTKTNKIYYGPDSCYPKSWADRFMSYDSLYPLKKVKYENSCFYIPNKVEQWLDIAFQDWNSLPDDVGFSHHLYYKDLYLKNKKL